MDKIIKVSQLNKWYGDFHALTDVDLDVNLGERIVICGPSGSGKSTMIRCLNRLEIFQGGTVEVDGIELTRDIKNIEAVRREVGMVFQHFNLFPHLTVLDNCTFALRWVRKMPVKEAEELAMNFLTRVRIHEHAHKFPGQLSGGQQQRVAIARAPSSWSGPTPMMMPVSWRLKARMSMEPSTCSSLNNNAFRSRHQFRSQTPSTHLSTAGSGLPLPWALLYSVHSILIAS
ncbi:ATP-binding cassette domain-containing protein [Rhodobacterales bacterium FZCC0188]|nr:ATP-binding cassette domain-containing protein [Rhodobacterales bacterium FZCC0188]